MDPGNNVLLYCALIGADNLPVFPVLVSKTLTVGELKKKIHDEISGIVLCDALTLELYLAKKADGSWVKENELSDLENIRDFPQLKYATARLGSVGLAEDQLGEVDEAEEAVGNGSIHILVVPGSGSAVAGSVGVPFKKPRFAYEREENATKTLREKIRAWNADSIFDLDSIAPLPFPSISTKANRFRLDENLCFEYQAREELKPLYEEVKSFWKKTPTLMKVNVVGTIGYGKSYMLAALVLLLLKYPLDGKPFVCYVPDCGELLGGETRLMAVMQGNVLLNIPDFVGPLEAPHDIRAAIGFSAVDSVVDCLIAGIPRSNIYKQRLDKTTAHYATHNIV